MPVDSELTPYRLTARVGHFAARRLIPRADWQFGRMVDGRHVADPVLRHAEGWIPTRVSPTKSWYESQNPPIVGLGLAAVRDMASAMKYDPAIVAPGSIRLHVWVVADRAHAAHAHPRRLHDRRA